MTSDHTTGEPIEPFEAKLHVCSCLYCRAIVWHWPLGLRSDGRALVWDRPRDGLAVHDCEPATDLIDLGDLDDWP